MTLAAWVAEYYACGAGEAIAAAMPPRAWIESERYARITDAGGRGCARARAVGAPRSTAWQRDKPVRVGARSEPVAARTPRVVALERDGLVTITQPLKGKASTFRTVRVAHADRAGHSTPQPRRQSPTARRSSAQRSAKRSSVLRGAPEGIEPRVSPACGSAADADAAGRARARVVRPPTGRPRSLRADAAAAELTAQSC